MDLLLENVGWWIFTNYDNNYSLTCNVLQCIIHPVVTYLRSIDGRTLAAHISTLHITCSSQYIYFPKQARLLSRVNVKFVIFHLFMSYEKSYTIASVREALRDCTFMNKVFLSFIEKRIWTNANYCDNIGICTYPEC